MPCEHNKCVDKVWCFLVATHRVKFIILIVCVSQITCHTNTLCNCNAHQLDWTNHLFIHWKTLFSSHIVASFIIQNVSVPIFTQANFTKLSYPMSPDTQNISCTEHLILSNLTFIYTRELCLPHRKQAQHPTTQLPQVQSTNIYLLYLLHPKRKRVETK